MATPMRSKIGKRIEDFYGKIPMKSKGSNLGKIASTMAKNAAITAIPLGGPLLNALNRGQKFLNEPIYQGGPTRGESLGKGIDNSTRPFRDFIDRRTGEKNYIGEKIGGVIDTSKDIASRGVFGEGGIADRLIPGKKQEGFNATLGVKPSYDSAQQEQGMNLLSQIRNAPDQNRSGSMPFINRSLPAATNQMFPNSNKAAAMFGIRTTTQNAGQLAEASRNKQIQGARTLEGKQRMRDKFASEDTANLDRQADIQKAMAGDQETMMKLATQYKIADEKGRRDLNGELFKAAAGVEGTNREEIIQNYNGMIGAIAGQEGGADQNQAGNQTAAMDINGDNQVSDAEIEYNKVATLLKKQKGKMTPSEELWLNNKAAELKKQLLG